MEKERKTWSTTHPYNLPHLHFLKCQAPWKRNLHVWSCPHSRSPSLPCSLPHNKWWESPINSLCHETLSVSQATPLTCWPDDWNESVEFGHTYFPLVSRNFKCARSLHCGLLHSCFFPENSMENRDFPSAWVLEWEDALNLQESPPESQPISAFI